MCIMYLADVAILHQNLEPLDIFMVLSKFGHLVQSKMALLGDPDLAREDVSVWLQGMRQPPEAAQEVTDRSESGAGDFTATLANFMAGGIDAAMPDLAGARGGSGQPPEEALLSPVPTAGCHVLAAPPSAAGSVPGSSGNRLHGAFQSPARISQAHLCF